MIYSNWFYSFLIVNFEWDLLVFEMVLIWCNFNLYFDLISIFNFWWNLSINCSKSFIFHIILYFTKTDFTRIFQFYLKFNNFLEVLSSILLCIWLLFWSDFNCQLLLRFINYSKSFVLILFYALLNVIYSFLIAQLWMWFIIFKKKYCPWYYFVLNSSWFLISKNYWTLICRCFLDN